MPVNLIAEVQPYNNGQFAIVDQKNVRGGYRSVNQISDRDTIFTDDRYEGMLVYVINENVFFQLASDLITWNEINLDKSFSFEQPMSSTIWTINHNLGKNPSVTIIDYSGNNLNGLIEYIDLNNLTITFSPAASGNVYLN